MNEALLKAQTEWNYFVVEPYFEANKNTVLSRPYYMGVSNEYIRSSNRIMIIGQETKDFGLYTDDWPMNDIREWGIDYLQKQLYGIESTKNKCKYNRSAFWKLFRLFEQKGFAPCWNNIDKIQQTIDEKTVPLTLELESHFCQQYGNLKKSLIQNEIDVCKPKSILFITGPNYTHSMATSFGIDETLFWEYRPNIINPISDITDILNNGTKSIWTYHPTFLNRKHILEDVVKSIIEIL